jgi:hypothetical protein
MNRSGGQYASDYHYLALHASAGTSTKDTGNRATQKFMSKSDVGSSRASTRYRETRKLSCHSSAVNKQMICSRRQRLLSAHLLVWQADNGLCSLLRRRLKVSLENTYMPTATFTNPTNPRENQSPRRQSGTVSNPQQPHHSSSVYKHVRTNTAPATGVHMLVQLLLCIGLPIVILPTLTAIGYFGLRYLKSRKNARMDVERGDCIKTSTRKSSGSDGESEESKYVMTPALVTNSVQVPAGAVVRDS